MYMGASTNESGVFTKTGLNFADTYGYIFKG